MNDIKRLSEYILALLDATDSSTLSLDIPDGSTNELAASLSTLGSELQKTRRIAAAIAGGDLDIPSDSCRNSLVPALEDILGDLKQLICFMKEIAGGDYTKRIDGTGPLASTFNSMADALQQQNERMNRLSFTDALTGVGNRSCYNLRAKALWDAGTTFAISFIDIDSLKYCNDTFGHSAGDHYIRAICKALTDIAGEGEQLFRIGGDEFVFLSLRDNAKTLDRRLTDIRHRFATEFNKTVDFRSGFSFGSVDMDPSCGKTRSELLSRADQLMYNFKVSHYLQQKYVHTYQPATDGSIDTTGLDSRIFEVFGATSPNRYTYLCNMSTGVSRWSMQAVQDFDLPSEYIFETEKVWVNYIHPDDRQVFLDDIEAVFTGKKKLHDVEYRARTKDGNYIMCSCEGCILRGSADGEPDLFAGTLTSHGIPDSYDPVTGCLNVYSFLKELFHLRLLNHGAEFLAIAFQQFSAVNSSIGYSMGNSILHSFAEQATELVRGSGRIFKMEGAKFVLMFTEGFPEDVQKLFSRLQDIARNRLDVQGRHISLSISGASMSAASFDVDESTLQTELLHALQIAKGDSSGNLYQHNAASTDDRMRLMDTIKQSILDGCKGFSMVYQPQVDPQRRVIGVESLLRWQNDSYGMIFPVVFVPWLESDPCFYTLGLWILRTSLKEMKPLLKVRPELSVSVNVSFRQIEHNGFPEDVLQILQEEGFPASNLILELTEHCQMLNPKVLLQYVRHFQKHGIRISADDFGTGYSSFGLMKQLPFDCVKIDYTFTRDVMDSHVNMMIVDAIIRCAKELGMKVCAEGIETQELFDFMKQFNVDYFQGYLFARPITREAVEQML